MPTVAEAVITCLHANGVDTFFGIPGVHTVELYRGLNASKVRHIQPKHEQNAAFMADGYARASGRPAGCVVISGPGMLNASTAIAQARSDSVPMLVLTTVAARKDLGIRRGNLHELAGQADIASRIAAEAHTLLDPDNIRPFFRSAFNRFAAGRPGPAYMELPLDLAGEQIDADDAAAERFPACYPPAPSAGAISAALDVLSSAGSVVIIAGGGAVGASGGLEKIAETFDAPVVTTTAGKGAFPAAHPLSAGSTISRRSIQALIEDADAVLAIGTELAEPDTLLGDRRLQLRGRLVRIDIDPAQLFAQYAPAVAIQADAALTIEALAARLQGDEGLRQSGAAARIARIVAAEKDKATAAAPLEAEFCAALRKAMPDDGIVVADSTMPAYFGNVWYPIERPGTWLTSSRGFGTLGWALPAAIGASLACPDRKLVCLVGDGGLLFTLEELVTACEQRLPLPVIVWNNGGYQAIRDALRARGCSPLGTDFAAPRLEALSESFGAGYRALDDVADLGPVLRDIWNGKRPTLIEIDLRQP